MKRAHEISGSIALVPDEGELGWHEEAPFPSDVFVVYLDGKGIRWQGTEQLLDAQRVELTGG